MGSFIKEGRYKVAIVTYFGEVRFTPNEYEFVKSLPTTVVDDEHIYDLDKIREDSHFLKVYKRLNPNFTKLSLNVYRTMKEETGVYEPDLIKAVAQDIPFSTLEAVWGITERNFNKAETLNKLLYLGVIDEEGTISTEGVEIALDAGIEEKALVNLGIPQSFIDLAISSTD